MKTPCMEPRCPDFATYRGRCSRHSRQQDKAINRAGRNIYSTKRWGILRRRKLSLNPICEYPTCNQLASDVHHKHGVEIDPWSLDGLEALCHAHHSRETRKNQMRAT